jgi:hypothetical protein
MIRSWYERFRAAGWKTPSAVGCWGIHLSPTAPKVLQRPGVIDRTSRDRSPCVHCSHSEGLAAAAPTRASKSTPPSVVGKSIVAAKRLSPYGTSTTCERAHGAGSASFEVLLQRTILPYGSSGKPQTQCRP